MILSSTINETSRADSKRAAFVHAAREMFFGQGYAGTSMSGVAAKVGGSKTTLWTYFPSKEALFAAVVDELVDRYGQSLAMSLDPELELPHVLRLYGASMMGIIMSPPIIALHRLVVGEAGRFPELGALLYERGPGRGKAKLAAWLAQAMDEGEVRRGNPLRAAAQFSHMCQSGIFQACIHGLKPKATADEIAGDIEAAVDSFVRAWGVNAG